MRQTAARRSLAAPWPRDGTVPLDIRELVLVDLEPENDPTVQVRKTKDPESNLWWRLVRNLHNARLRLD